MTDIPEVIFLCGFSGSGKTETGEILAKKLDYGYLDTDRTVEETLGKTIPEIFAKDGEGKFRFAEWDIIRMALKSKPRVIALGGGTIGDDNNLAYVKDNGYLVYLQVKPETVYERLLTSHLRPMLQAFSRDEKDQEEIVMKRIRDLLSEREAFYLKADMIVNTEGRTPEEVAEEIKGKLS